MFLKRPRPGALQTAVQSATQALALVALLTVLLVHRSQNKDSASPPQAVLSVVHHKTGTALSGCIFGTSIETLDASGQQRVFYSYLNQLTDVQDLVVRFGMGEAFTSDLPAAYLGTGTGLQEQCYDSGLLKTHMLMHPRPKTKCPCSYGESNCFSIGHCSTLVPSSLALKVVHFIRNPLDIITSAFLYHSQLPPPESWLLETSVGSLRAWFQDLRVPHHLHPRESVSPNMTYSDYITSMADEGGLQVEAIRCLFDVWQMARLYVRHAAHPNFLHVRFEDFKTGFRQKVAEILTFAHIQPSRGGMAAHLDKVSRACNVQSWDQNKLHATDHVTFHKSSGKERLQQAVMQDAFLRQQVCRLQALLDYPLHEACAGTES